MKNQITNKNFSQKAKTVLAAAFVAGGLFGGQAAKAATTSASVPERVAAVRDAMNKKIAEAKETGGTQAVEKLPYAQLEVASWLNWINWPNWNNWANWANWSNWINF